MIIDNGTIRVKSKRAGGISMSTGFPNESTGVEWGDPVPCQWYHTAYDRVADAEGNTYVRRNLVILVEGTDFTAEQIELSDETGTAIGEYTVRSVEPLRAVGQTKLTIWE